jgi:hypothetical protein
MTKADDLLFAVAVVVVGLIIAVGIINFQVDENTVMLERLQAERTECVAACIVSCVEPKEGENDKNR